MTRTTQCSPSKSIIDKETFDTLTCNEKQTIKSNLTPFTTSSEVLTTRLQREYHFAMLSKTGTETSEIKFIGAENKESYNQEKISIDLVIDDKCDPKDVFGNNTSITKEKPELDQHYINSNPEPSPNFKLTVTP